MSPIGPENFHRLEEFPSFVSCIKCFGRPIIPPLLNPNRRHELKQLGIAAAQREADILRRKKSLTHQREDANHIPFETYGNCYSSDFLSSTQESCALWYPSAKDCPEGISVAISKFPTSEIYSSIHTGAIVCSNVIESNSLYNVPIGRDSLLVSEGNTVDCVECSHNSINLACSLCQAEYNQSFQNKSFTAEISPEVPCRTYSLLQHDNKVEDNELNCTAEETDCESLPTVICNHKYVPLEADLDSSATCNQKYVPPDTDSESIATCMTQSTDLEKYMEFSCEFSSPDTSATAWDMKSSSQQHTLSRSDDASSETIVNTENELTPCASTLAELTDNIEDELSNADETAAVSDIKEVTSGTMKRAHSVDSYMKIIQMCAKSMNVRKSQSVPFNTDLKTELNAENDLKTPVGFKTGLLIKEDSKESEESKDIPEKEISPLEETKDMYPEKENSLGVKADTDSSLHKKHVRQNSYTLEHPSSALILAHADCTCNFDANCISPHCSALQDENGILFNSAFTKEKVEVNIPVSHDQMSKLPVLSSVHSSEDVISTKEDMRTAIDIFPIVKEYDWAKSDSGNAQMSEAAPTLKNTSSVEMNTDSKPNEKSSHVMFAECHSDKDKKQEYFQHIYQKLQESREMRMKQLFEQQNQEWLRLQDEFKQEMLLYQNLKPTVITTVSPPKAEEEDQMKFINCASNEKTEQRPSSDKELSISNSSVSSLNEIPSSDSSLMQNCESSILSNNLQSLCSPSKNLILPQNTRASISPSNESNSLLTSPSKPLDTIRKKQLFKDTDLSSGCDFTSNENHADAYISESPFQTVNGFPRTSPVLLPHRNSPANIVSVPSSEICDNMYACVCDKPVKQCESCTSVNGYCEYDINVSCPEYMPTFLEPNPILDYNSSNLDIDFLHSQNSSSTSEIQSRSVKLNSLVSYQNTNKLKKTHSSSKIGNDCTSTKNDASSSAFNNLESLNLDQKSVLAQVSKAETKILVDKLPLCTKNLKNGSFCPSDARHKKMINDPTLSKKFKKLPAFVKGYLTRRLFKTELVQGHIKTLTDTYILIKKLSEDLSAKGDSVTERDVDFHNQLIAQLLRTFHDFYDIFCTISTKERMSIIAKSRSLRLKSVSLDQKQESDVPVITHAPDPALSKKHKLSSATLKALERKRRSAIDTRTYTVEDFKNTRSRSVIEMRTVTIDDLPNYRERTHSSMSPKDFSVSPSLSCYKTSVGVCMKRKTASAKSRSRQCLQHKWVP